MTDTGSLAEQDRLIVESTVRDVTDGNIDHLIGAHKRIIREQSAKRARLDADLAGIERSIAMRTYAIELLAAKRGQ